MPKVEINGISYDAIVGESLLGVGRANKAHIGYACGGNGVCQTCEVTVESGMSALSEMNDVEKSWLTPAKIADFHRLGCQARITGDEHIQVVTRAEVFRHKFNNAFKDQPAVPTDHPQGYVGEFFSYLGYETLAHLAAVPAVTINSFQRVGDGRLTFQVINDTINAWGERFPEFGSVLADITGDVGKMARPLLDAIGDATRNLPDALRPLGDAFDDATRNLPDAVRSVTDVVAATTRDAANVVADATDRITKEARTL
ncbi:MAG: 2Fe-2S iron-sulfur cluster binding domain-containing protein [Rhizobacter sp.]|nr:2Fe-2S iron-sulfur cluster binding domain-containing protein [Chlorobiales bacterium]